MKITDDKLKNFNEMVTDFACRNELQSQVIPRSGNKVCEVTFFKGCMRKIYVVIWDEVRSLTEAASNIFADVMVRFVLTTTYDNLVSFEIKDVIFNNPATIVLWKDGTKTVVKCQPGDVYSKETGLALCIVKKALGNEGNFNNVFRKWIPEEESQDTTMPDEMINYFRELYKKVFGVIGKENN